jgi:hypothetical protein
VLGDGAALNWLQIINIFLSIMFLCSFAIGVIMLLIYFIRKHDKTKKSKMIYETYASFNPLKTYPRICHLLVFSLSRFIMALLIALSGFINTIAICTIFLFVCLISFFV